jgi:two-component system osmolarity sensor histidine kinase EnvZ
MGDRSDLTDDMVRDIEDMDAILDQFLAFIRDGRDESVEEVDLSDLVREVVRRTTRPRKSAPAPGTDPAVPAAPGVDEAPAEQPDRQRLHAGSGVEVAAYVSGDTAAPYVVLSVLDRGAGIDPAELEAIFNPFTRGDRARGGKGTGLGWRS